MPEIIERDFLFDIAGKRIPVVSFTIHERVSTPFKIEIRCAYKEEIRFDDVIGKESLFTLSGGPSDRFFHGVVTEFMHVGGFENLIHYQVTMMPLVYLLSLEKDCRIFQKMDVKDIVTQVLKDGGITADKFDFRLSSSYEKRDYCVQYRETDLNFISRLLEEEGVFYFFEEDEKRHRMVFGDSKVNYKPIDTGHETGAPSEVKFHSPDTMSHSEDSVQEITLCRKIRSGKVTLNDFNFKKPKVNLKVVESESTFSQFELYDYPGEYMDDKRGKELAKIRLEEARLFLDRAEGKSDCVQFVPGFTFKLIEHGVDDFNQEYVLTEVTHVGSQKQTEGGSPISKGFSYYNDFVCIPSTVTFRPERKTPVPVVEGVQTAIVVGPAGEEIYTDEHGRVKVQFHWDRLGKKDESSSCWIRVSHAWAGAGWGAIYIPRIGQEVIVDFEEGDPDKPIIIGRVYHGENNPPYPLPSDKTKSTIKSNSTLGGGGSNEFRFEDKKGNEEIYLHGQKNWTILIENDKNQTIGHDETLSVKNNRTKEVKVDQSETIGSNKMIKVGLNHSETIGKDATIEIGLTLAQSVGKDKSVSVAKNQSVSIGQDLSMSVGKNESKSVGENASVQVGKNFSGAIGEKADFSVGKDGKVQIEGNVTLSGQKKMVIDIQDELTLKCGNASIILKKNGDIQIKGNKLNLKASGDIKMKGSKIAEN